MLINAWKLCSPTFPLYPRGDCWYLNWFEDRRQRRESLGRISATDAESHRKACLTWYRAKRGFPMRSQT